MIHTRTLSVLFVAAFAACLAILVFTSSAEASTSRGRNASSTAATVDASCVQTAVDTREDALMAAWDTFGEAIGTALGARKSALHDAWGLSDRVARNKAIVAAWKEWRTDSKDAYKEVRGDRKSAWDAYKKTMKSECRTDVPKDEVLGKDEAGSIAL